MHHLDLDETALLRQTAAHGYKQPMKNINLDIRLGERRLGGSDVQYHVNERKNCTFEFK